MTLVVLVSERDHAIYPTAHRLGLRDRLVARVRRFALDAALAGGLAPDASPALELRAQQLLEPAVRRHLGKQIQQILHSARGPARMATRRVPMAPETVRAVAPELQYLAVRLLDEKPISVRGIACTLMLLRDGAGPLYGRDPHQLRDALDAAAKGLDQYD